MNAYTCAVDGARLRSAVEGFGDRTIVVVGDLIVDEYLSGKPARISREAPVLILRFSERDVRLGGAANAAHNVHALGARAVAIGVVGRDAPGDDLLRPLPRRGVADRRDRGRGGTRHSGEDADHGGRLPRDAPAGRPPRPRAGRRHRPGHGARVARAPLRPRRGRPRHHRLRLRLRHRHPARLRARPRPRPALGQRGHRGQPVRSAPLHRGHGRHAERGRAGAAQRRVRGRRAVGGEGGAPTAGASRRAACCS